VANVYANSLRLNEVEEITVSDAELQRVMLEKGDLLIVEGNGSLDQIGRVAMWDGSIAPCVHQNHLIKARCLDSSLPQWVLYWLLSPEGRELICRQASSTSGLHTLSLSKVSGLPVRIAPADVRRSTVEALDSYLTRLDAATEGLKRVEANLKRYRASVLKAAVEGNLVPTEAELAKEEKREFEPASVLLERILKERRHRWEQAELAKMKAKGEVPKNDKWKDKYEEPAAPDTSELPELPEGWCWASAEQLDSGDRTSGYGVLVPGPDVEDGVPLVRVGDIQNGRVITADIKRISRKIADAFSRTYLRGGEVLLSLVGTIGRTAVVPESLAGANVARAVAVLPVTSLVRAKWIEIWFRSPVVRTKLSSKAHEVARKTLNLEDVRLAAVALPPRLEQERIETAVEDAESVVDNCEGGISCNLGRFAHLRQSILRWAFEGKLVDQNPNDEPASVLLKRIRSERESSQPVKPCKPERTRRKTA
jgi:hypothetical protein